MADVLVYERTRTPVPDTLARRGHHIVYRANSSNHCPGCGRSQWYVGRISAECGFCGTAIALAEGRYYSSASGASVTRSHRRPLRIEKRRSPRLPAEGRSLQLLVDGSPSAFALHNISECGAMGDAVMGLAAHTEVYVQFESGLLVPAVVKWAEDGLVGLAFTIPVPVGTSPH